MIRLLHHYFCDERRVLDLLNRADSPAAPRRTMHYAGIKLDDAIFIRQAAVAHRVVIGIVLNFGYHGKGGVERVPAGPEDRHSGVKMLHAVMRGNNQWPSPLRRPRDWQRFARNVFRRRFKRRCCAEKASCAYCDASSKRCKKEIST